MVNFFLKASANELVPMLRRMEDALAAGKSVQEAYAAALHETQMLKHLVGEPAPNLPFGEALLEGAKTSKIRPLAELVASFQGGNTSTVAAARVSRRQRRLFIAGVVFGSLVVLRLVRR
jgi:hypothetical protein